MNAQVSDLHLDAFIQKIETRSLTAGITGGYVDLPLTHLFTSHGFKAFGLGIDNRKAGKSRASESYIKHIPKVAIVYHFLPHYRAGVFTKLLESTTYNYIFVAGHNNLDLSIPEWVVPDRARFVEALCHPIRMPLFYQSGLAKLALRTDINAIIYLGAPYSVSTWYSAILGRMTGKRVLFWTHGWIKTNGWWRERIKECFMRLADILLLYGERSKTIGQEKGFPSDRMVVVYNSLDYAQQKLIRDEILEQELISLRVQMFGDSGTPVVICTARLNKNCDFELLLRAQADLCRSGKVVNVVLVGEGPERVRLEELARSESLPVAFIGACYDERRLARLIRSANVTVSPGKIGLTAIHSLTYGTPVITHDDISHQGPESEAISPGVNGDLFRRGDAVDLARVIWKWCSRPWPDLGLREQCYDVIERHYNPVIQIQIIESALSSNLK